MGGKNPRQFGDLAFQLRDRETANVANWRLDGGSSLGADFKPWAFSPETDWRRLRGDRSGYANCSPHRSGIVALIRLIRDSLGGWRPSRIASTRSGARKASGIDAFEPEFVFGIKLTHQCVDNNR
ncbi:hypothetical protein ATE48_12640 [Candidatus Viadribacter manganicus]|uniref:Uncharacterized protein n=1 Tax=Candidatus Viadribacter manganicus TaxID=1759059 RepID=A0A1B1AJG4_9PROT|nr:hypothetical protein ATE48_12640 [Candidatus Viadribacter manganicus]